LKFESLPFCEDIAATHKFVVYSGTERFPMAGGAEAIGLIEFLKLIETEGRTPRSKKY